MKNKHKAARKAAAITAAVCAVLCMSAFSGGWTARQEAAHEIAELARSIGLDEGHPIIQEARAIWWEEYNADAEIGKVSAGTAQEASESPETDFSGTSSVVIPEADLTAVEPLSGMNAEREESQKEPEPELERESEPVYEYLGRYYVTGYDTCYQCCGKTDGITASGAVATVGRTVAAAGFEFGTCLYIPGIGERVVEDRGPQSGDVIDVLCNNHDECYEITGWYDVYVLREDFV